MDGPQPAIRLDKWLWHARFFKTRGLAAAQVTAGHVRMNGTKVHKPGHVLRAGDTLTFPQGDRIRVIRVRDIADRRGPAVEAQGLYTDLAAEPETDGTDKHLPPATRLE